MLKPLGDNLIVEVIKPEETTQGGIILSEADVSRGPSKGKVIAVGSGAMLTTGVRAPLEVNVGDTVMFPKFIGAEVEYEGVKYLILKERDIMLTL